MGTVKVISEVKPWMARVECAHHSGGGIYLDEVVREALEIRKRGRELGDAVAYSIPMKVHPSLILMLARMIDDLQNEKTASDEGNNSKGICTLGTSGHIKMICTYPKGHNGPCEWVKNQRS